MKHARRDYDDRIQDTAGLIPDDEPVLLIRGQDASALAACDAWITDATSRGVTSEVIDSIRRHRSRVADWQAAHGAKPADAPAHVLA